MKRTSLIIFIIIIIYCPGCMYKVEKWHVEQYVLEGGGYFLTNKKAVIAKKKYIIADEDVSLVALPQKFHTEIENWIIHSTKTTGPYKIRIMFSPGYRHIVKKIIIHNITIESSINRNYDISSIQKLPIEVESLPYSNSLHEEDKISYYHTLIGEYDFMFNEKEEITLLIDIEVFKDKFQKREKKALKMVPLLDKGTTLRIAGDDV